MTKERKNGPVLITHEMSNLGRININLFGLAAEFYSIAQADGLIDYLKKVDHLGFISKSHPGNHHKRWDYVCLQLLLIQKLKHPTLNTGLGTTVRLGEIEASNQELLQFFVLFANVGHLEGTISSERALLDHLRKDSEKKDKFFSNIDKNKSLKGIADSFFSSGDPYKVKYLIALNYVLAKTSHPNLIKTLESIINAFVLGQASADKIRNIFYRVRRISFIYLDSHHCHTPLQLNISKILINIFNYDEIFNPVEHDYDKILDASETILTKQIYISPVSSFAYQINYDAFLKYLEKFKAGKRQINYSNFLFSALHGRSEKFELKFPNTNNFWIFQYYFAKDALRVFDIPFSNDFSNIASDLFSKEAQLQNLLTKDLGKTKGKIALQYDMRRTLLFFTLILNKQLTTQQIKICIRNVSAVIHSILDQVKFPSVGQPEIRNELDRSFKNDIIRRHFLYVLNLLFDQGHRLNIYIKFQYKQIQEQINRSRYFQRLYEANFATNKVEFESVIDMYLQMLLPKDIKNNLKLLKEIATKYSQIKGEAFYYFIVLPVEIEQRVFEPAEVDRTGNSEKKSILTDIDAILLVFTGQKYELFLVEGKDVTKGFAPECTADLKRLMSIGTHGGIYKGPVIISEKNSGAKGGYIQISG